MPKENRVAVVGASRNRRKFGNKCVRAYRHAGWAVFPVNPAASDVEGIPAFASLGAIPGPVDRISLYTPPARTRALLENLPKDAEIFFNPGTADASVLEAARDLGLQVRDRCAIADIGLSPGQFGDQETE